ncbi:MAG: ABC transporter permease [Planctomycetota bacterium]
MVYKELLQARRDPATLFLALAIPVIQLTIFGFAINTEIRDIPTVVVDRAGVRVSREFVRALEGTGTFRIVGHAADRDAAMTLLREGRAKTAVLLPDDLPERLLAGETAAVQFLIDGSDSNMAMQAQAAALGVAASFGPPRPPLIEARPRLLYNPDGRSETFFVPGLLGIILQLVTTTLTAFAIVRERERGTLEQLMVTPVSRLALTLGKILPSVLVGAAATVLALLAMVHVFAVEIRGDPRLLAALTGLFLFTSLAVGLLISAVARTQLQALMMTLLLMLPSVLLSGFMFSRDGMPTPIREITWLLPATYFIEIMRGVVLRAASAQELLRFIVPLAALGLVFYVLAALRFRKYVA